MFGIATILGIIFKGMLIGMIVSAPMGPVGVLCLQRTLNKGRWFGFVTGCGAALSDLLYALITGYGMSFVFDYINNNIFWLQLIGSMLLLAFGFYTFQSNPMKSIRPEGQRNSKASYTGNFITAFFVTLSNPLIILLFIALFARFSFVDEGTLLTESVAGYVSIVTGALLWWFMLTSGVAKLRGQFNVRGIWILNRIIGGTVMAVSVIGLAFTLLGQSLY